MRLMLSLGIILGSVAGWAVNLVSVSAWAGAIVGFAISSAYMALIIAIVRLARMEVKQTD